MQTIRIGYQNFIRDALTVTPTSAHPQFPAAYMMDDDTTLPFRTRYGTGSGNGTFVIGAANKYIDFDEGGAELTATITPGTYNGNTLAAEIKTRMDAAGGTYLVTYAETSGLFTIDRSDSGSNYTLRWLSGTHTATSAGVTLGFIVSANKSGANLYVSDYARFNYPSAGAIFDLGAAKTYDLIAVLNHNITSAATAIKIVGADDAAMTTNVVTDSLTWNGVNIVAFLGTARTKRYVQLYVEDPANPSGYVQVGTLVLSKYYDLGSKGYADFSDGGIDYTVTAESPSKNIFVTQSRPTLNNRLYSFTNLAAPAYGYIKAMIAEVGNHLAFLLCEDYTAPNTTSYWVLSKTQDLPAYTPDGVWTWKLGVEDHV